MEIDLFNYQSIYGLNSNFDTPQEADSGNYLTTSTGRRLPYKRFGAERPSYSVGEEGISYENTDFSLVERFFTENKSFAFNAGSHITSPDDVAWMFRSLEDSAVEHVFLVYHFEDDGYFVQHLSSGGITSSVVDMRVFVGNVLQARPTSVTLVHNHPSGSLKASKEDFNIQKKIYDFFFQHDILVNDGIIINLRSGMYVAFSHEDSIISLLPTYPVNDSNVSVYSFDRQVFAENYNPVALIKSEDTAAYLSTQKFGISDKTELLVLNLQNQIMGKFLLPQSGQLAKIIELTTLYGGTSAILYGNNVTDEMHRTYSKHLDAINIKLLDSIRYQGENIYSLEEAGIIAKADIERAVNRLEAQKLKVSEEQQKYNTDMDELIDSPIILDRLKSAFPYTPVHLLSAEEIQKRISQIREAIPELSGSLFRDADSVPLTSISFAPGTTTAAPADPSRIDDYGEKIGGARKDLYQRSYESLQELASFDFEDSNIDIKDNIFKKGIAELLPFPNLTALSESGYNAYVLKTMVADYSEITKKPVLGTHVRSSKVTKLLSWFTRIQQIARNFSTIYYNANDPKYVEFLNKAATEKWEQLTGSEHVPIRLRVLNELFELTKFPNETAFNYKLLRGLDIQKSYYGGDNYTLTMGNQTFYRIQPNELATEIYGMILKGEKNEEQKTAKKEKEYKILCYTDRLSKTHFLAYKLKNGELYRFKEIFQTSDEAFAYRKANRPEMEEQLRVYELGMDEALLRGKLNEEREGLQYRSQFDNGDVPIAEFAAQFGFRGIEFGNYVSNRERQEHVNKAYDGFMDLANVLNVPPKSLSLNGELGIGFGSRGRGGKNAALAHYEPVKVVINLTKNKGAGSLAHEWWHAFDNYMGRTYIDGGYLSTRPKFNSIRTEIMLGYDAVLNTIEKDTWLKARSINADGGRKKPYYSQRIEMTARAFESYVKYKLDQDGIKNDYLVNVSPESLFIGHDDIYPYPKKDELEKFASSYDKLFSAVQIKEENDRVIMYHATNGQHVLGFTYDNEMFFDREKLNSETLIHDFGHLWVDAIEANNPELYERGLSLLEEGGSRYLDMVEQNPFYKDYTGEQKRKEALVHAIGDRGRMIVEKNETKGKFLKFLGDVKKFIGNTFFFQKSEHIESLSFDQFLDSAVHDLLQGQELPLRQKTEQELTVHNSDVGEGELAIYSPINKHEAEYLLSYSDGAAEIYGRPIDSDSVFDEIRIENAEGLVAGNFREFYVETDSMEPSYIEELNSELLGFRAVQSEMRDIAEDLSKKDLYASILVSYIESLNSQKQVAGSVIQRAYNSLTDEEKLEFDEFVRGMTFEGYTDEMTSSLDPEDLLNKLKDDVSQTSEFKIMVKMGVYDDQKMDEGIHFQEYSFDSFEEFTAYLDMQKSHYDTNPALAVRVGDNYPVHLLTEGAVLTHKEILEEVIEKYGLNIELVTNREQEKEQDKDKDKEQQIDTQMETENIMDLIPEERRGGNFHIKVSKMEAEYLVGNDIVSDIMNAEYGEDEAWVGMTKDDLDAETGIFDDEYQTFEIDVTGITRTNLEALLHEIDKYAQIPEFDIKISEHLSRTITVKAGDAAQAETLARRMYQDEKVVLDYSDVKETNFELISPLTEKETLEVDQNIETHTNSDIINSLSNAERWQESAFTTANALEYQQKNLDEWKNVLKPEVYERLQEMVTSTNYQAASPYDITRGQKILEILTNDIILPVSNGELAIEPKSDASRTVDFEYYMFNRITNEKWGERALVDVSLEKVDNIIANQYFYTDPDVDLVVRTAKGDVNLRQDDNSYQKALDLISDTFSVHIPSVDDLKNSRQFAPNPYHVEQIENFFSIISDFSLEQLEIQKMSLTAERANFSEFMTRADHYLLDKKEVLVQSQIEERKELIDTLFQAKGQDIENTEDFSNSDIDLFNHVAHQPKILRNITEYYEGVDMRHGLDHVDIEQFLNEVKTQGYIFDVDDDFKLSNLRPIDPQVQLTLYHNIKEGSPAPEDGKVAQKPISEILDENMFAVNYAKFVQQDRHNAESAQYFKDLSDGLRSDQKLSILEEVENILVGTNRFGNTQLEKLYTSRTPELEKLYSEARLFLLDSSFQFPAPQDTLQKVEADMVPFDEIPQHVSFENRSATHDDFREGATLVTKDGDKFVLTEKYDEGVWNARGLGGGKVIFENEAQHYTVLPAEGNNFPVPKDEIKPSVQNTATKTERLPYRDWLINEVNEVYPNAQKANIHQVNKMFLVLDSYELEEVLKDLGVPSQTIDKANKIEEWLNADASVKKVKSEIMTAINGSKENVDLFKDKFMDMVAGQSKGIKR